MSAGHDALAALARVLEELVTQARAGVEIADDLSAAATLLRGLARQVVAEPALLERERAELVDHLRDSSSAGSAEIERLRDAYVRRIEAQIRAMDATGDKSDILAGLRLLRDQLARRAEVLGYDTV
ncbi:hypothetical protein [Actinophytocola sp.]|uniref:hypothetical protein n=1 Tax=Actinophytocola sp. TaxID=1872138 RepID=UPI003D6C3A58